MDLRSFVFLRIKEENQGFKNVRMVNWSDFQLKRVNKFDNMISYLEHHERNIKSEIK